MRVLPTAKAKKSLRLQRPRTPNYNDYQGPADGDYVRYVQDLMDWAEQAQTRQRLQAARQASRAPAADWGRSPVPPAQPQPARAAAANPLQQLRNWARTTSAQLPAQLQAAREQAHASQPATPAGAAAPRAKRAQQAAHQPPADAAPKQGKASRDKASQVGPVVLMVVVALLMILGATQLIPMAIVVFVGYHLTRAVRGASNSNSNSNSNKKP